MMMNRIEQLARVRRASLVVPASFVLLLFAACGDPKPTNRCNLADEGTSICMDAKTAGLCKNLRRTPLPCRGPQGCKGVTSVGWCDTSIALEGDACDPKNETPTGNHVDVACSEDKSRSLACRGGKFVLDRLCRGPTGCDAAQIAAGSMQVCDRSVAELGDPCQTKRVGSVVEGVGVCSADRKVSLVCDNDDKGNFVVGSTCDGPKGCTPGQPGSLDRPAVCDQSVAVLGSPCGKLDTNRVSCTADGALVVHCDPTTLKWIEHKKCGPKTRCVYQKNKVVIDGLECAPAPGG
jgi:hypothetical protein